METLLLVLLLVNDLDSENYRVRHRAHTKLALQMDTQLYFALRDQPVKTCEAKSRVGSLLSQYEQRLYTYYQANMENTGYPAYPWIDCLPPGYEWEGFTTWQISKDYFNPYFQADCLPNWTNYRNATKAWMRHRLSRCLGQSLLTSKNQQEFTAIMDCAMKAIHHDLAVMIEREDAYWRGKENNPLRTKKK